MGLSVSYYASVMWEFGGGYIEDWLGGADDGNDGVKLFLCKG